MKAMIQPIDRDRVLNDLRQIGNLSRTAILTTAPQDSEAAQLGCALLALIFDGYSAVTTLLGTPGEYHAPTVVRTMFESFADLRALAADAAYARRMKLHAACERKKAVESYVTSYARNPEFEATARRAQQDVARLEQEIVRLVDEGATDYKIWQRFQFAGLEGDKAYLYGELSSFAHADYIAIMLRHLGRQRIILGDPLPEEWFAKVAFLSSTILLDGLLTLPAFAICDAAEIDTLRNEAVKHYQGLPLVDNIAPRNR